MDTLVKKTLKLIQRLETLSNTVKTANALKIHQQVNETYYSIKAEELKYLLEQVLLATRRVQTLQSQLENQYQDVFHQWRQDARWLHRHSVSPSKTIL